MANEQNLKPIRDSKRARELQEKAAQKQRENIARRKTLKEELLALLSLNGNQQKMSLAVLEKALGGNLKAFETIRDTIGEKAPEKVESTELQTSSYEDFIKATKGDEY